MSLYAGYNVMLSHLHAQDYWHIADIVAKSYIYIFLNK